MRCLVTGGAGFIGSHLVDRLVEESHKVSVVDDLSTGRLVNVNKGAKFYRIKIESPNLGSVFEETNPELIFHLAAQSQVKKSMDNPLLDARVNILGTVNLLILSLKYKIKKFIFSSSGGAIYGDTSKAATEDDRANPFSHYGLSKVTAEEYIKFYGRLELKYLILRYSNVYGPRQDPDGEAGVVAIWAKHMLKNEPCILYGFGKLVRDYVYVGDVIRATISAALDMDNQILNIGTGVPTSVDELFELMRGITNYSLKPVYQPKRDGEVEMNFLDWSKAKKLLGWEPKTSLKDGLKRTIDWFKQPRQGRSYG